MTESEDARALGVDNARVDELIDPLAGLERGDPARGARHGRPPPRPPGPLVLEPDEAPDILVVVRDERVPQVEDVMLRVDFASRYASDPFHKASQRSLSASFVQPAVGGHEPAPTPGCQCEVEAVIDGDPVLDGQLQRCLGPTLGRVVFNGYPREVAEKSAGCPRVKLAATMLLPECIPQLGP